MFYIDFIKYFLWEKKLKVNVPYNSQSSNINKIQEMNIHIT